MINVKDLLRNGYDPTPSTPRKNREQEVAANVDSLGNVVVRNKVNSVEVMDGLYGIAEEYDAAVKARAKAYADAEYRYDGASDESLYDEAKSYVDGVYAGKADSLTSSRDEKTRELTAKKESVGADRAAALRDLGKKYARAESSLLETLSRNGMMHSSVSELSREGLRSERAADLRETNATYDRKVEALDRKIEQTDASYRSALKNYEINYAIRLENRLNRLKSERDRAASDYDKEHAEDRAKAYDRYLFAEETANKQYEREHADYKGDKRQNYQARYDYLVGALTGYGKDAVSLFLSDNEEALRQYLGLYYDRFVREVS